MSRWRDEDREVPGVGAGGGGEPGAHPRPVPDARADRDHADLRSAHEPYVEHLDLPAGERREPVYTGRETTALNREDVRVLATVGTFRAVPVADLGPAGSRDSGSLRHLRDAGLLEIVTVTRARGESTDAASVAVLTSAGKALLDASARGGKGARQHYHAGLVKPQELSHDASLYRVYRAAARDLEAEGARVTRVVLDYELKAAYQRFLNRPDRAEGATLEQERATFATTQGLTVVDGHLELPDLRLEVEWSDGRRGVRDLELVTEHYSRSQLAGKRQAGFALYRASRPGGSVARGSTPYDPHQITRVLA